MELYPFQVEGARFLVANPRSILGDEMGLGKTVQAGAILDGIYQSTHDGGKVLVIGPGILAYSWVDLLQEHYGLSITPITDSSQVDYNLLAASNWVYVNYEKLRLPRFLNLLLEKRWDVIIVDEAHRFRESDPKKSQRTAGLLRLVKKTDRLYFLTGTPLPSGSPVDLFFMLKCIDGATFRSKWRFIHEWCMTEEVETNSGVFQRIGTARDPALFAKTMAKYILARTLEQSGRELPPVTTMRIRHPLSPRQRVMYQSMLKDFLFTIEAERETKDLYVEAPNTVARWENLRKICLTPLTFEGETDAGNKVEAILEVVDQSFASGRKVVVYTWHRAFASLLYGMIHKRFKKEGGIVMGGTGFQEQYDQANLINTGSDFVVGTIAAMSTGLNLQGASVVLFAEISYSPADNDQALKRVWREGQQNPVWVYYFIAKGTIEEHILETTRERRGDTATMMREYALAVKTRQ